MSRWRTYVYKIGLLFGAMFFCVQLWMALDSIKDHRVGVVNPPMLAFALACNLSAFGNLVLTWWVIVRMTFRALPLRHLFEGYALTFLPRYIPGSVWGYMSRGEWMLTVFGMQPRPLWTASVIEISLQLFTATAICLRLWLPKDTGIQASILFFGIVLIGALVAFQVGKRICRFQLTGGWQIPAVAMFCGMALWALQGLSLNFLIGAVAPAHQIPVSDAIGIFATAWIAGFLMFIVPSGLGVREWTLTAMLQQFAGMDIDTASVIAVLSRLMSLFGELSLVTFGIVLRVQREKWGQKHSLAHTRVDRRET